MFIQFFIYAIVAFLSGVLSFMSPCSLPLIPAYFGYASGSDRNDTVKNTLFFMFGLAFTFTLLGVFAGSLGSLVLSYKREMIFISSLILIFFGSLSIIGKGLKFENIKLKYNRTPLGSIIFGSLFGLIWSGCIGPVLGFILLLAANTGTAFTGGLLLFIHAIGLLFPLFIFSLFLSRLPMNGKFWKFMKGRLFKFDILGKTFFVHSTNLVSGIIFILLGILLLLEITSGVTGFISSDFINVTFDLQERLAEVFSLK